MGYRIRVTQP